MTDTHKSAVPELAHDVLQDSAMDQALDWLITLECASDEQKCAFETWLNADPAHAQAFAKANAIWNGEPLLAAAQSLPWAALLPKNPGGCLEAQAPTRDRLPVAVVAAATGVFQPGQGKLPSYIMPCLLPLALLMGHTLADKLAQGRYRALRINGWLNLVIGVVVLLALSWFQLKKPVYEHGQETFSLVLVFTFLFGWILVNLLQAAQPLRLWAAPILGSWLMVALLPAALPHSVVYNKTPDAFIIESIEQHLGAALFVQHAQGYELTPAGQALLKHVVPVLGSKIGGVQLDAILSHTAWASARSSMAVQ